MINKSKHSGGKSGGKYLAYINCVTYMWFAILVVGGTIQGWTARTSSDESAMMNMTYVIIASVQVSICFLITVGLIRFKNWGRLWATVWNVCIAFQLVGLKAIGYLVLVGMSSPTPEGFRFFDSDMIMWFILAIIFVGLSVSLNTKSVKRFFD